MSAQAPRQTLGIGLVIAATACFAAMDTTTRYLGAMMALPLMLWVRYTIHTVVMAGWVALDSRMRFRPRDLRFQLVRGVLLLTSSAMAFIGLQHLPVAEFTAIAMLTPVLVTVCARWLLDEPVSPLRWALVAGGFVGALVVIRPGSGLFGWSVLFPFVCACTNAGFQVLTGRFGASESPHTTNFYTGLTGSLLVAPVLLFGPIDVDSTLAAAPASQLGLLLAIGLLGTGGHLLLVMAFGAARTATLMPFTYAQIGFAALVGWLVFHAVPDAWSWVGFAVIALCGAGSAWLNAKRPVSVVAADTQGD